MARELASRAAEAGAPHAITFIWISFLVNIIVTYVISAQLLGKNSRMSQVYGSDSAARRILTCVYLSIGTLSVAALATPVKVEIAWVLFPMQIFYKLLTLPVVADTSNPVPWANVAISVLHAVTLGLNWEVLWNAMGW